LYIGVIVYLANMADLTHKYRPLVQALLNSLIFLMTYLGVLVIWTAFTPDPNLPPPDRGALLVFVPFWALAALGSAWFIHHAPTRTRLGGWLTKITAGQFRSEALVHQTALVLVLVLLVVRYANFVLLGGIEGYAAVIAAAPPTMLDILLELLINGLIALLGVGLFIRRTLPQTLQRLGVRVPTRQDVLAGSGLGVLLFIVMLGAQTLLAVLQPPDVVAQQNAAAAELFRHYAAALPLWLCLIVAAGVGEELLYRGALQPIFGIFATAIFFMLMHQQYAFTPAWIVIFLVGLGFAWLRQRYSTTAAILAHMLYNGLPFLFAMMGVL
jgi:hypothetical protein